MPLPLHQFDLNLIRVFLALYDTNSTSRAAEQLGLTQSAVSNALKRLRDNFDDEIFIRSRYGMEPTQIATNLRPYFLAAMQQLQDAFNAGAGFDPASAEDEILLGVSEYAELTLVPLLLPLLAREAPKLRLRFAEINRQNIAAQLDQDMCHLAFGVFDDLPARFTELQLFADRFLTLMRPEHPAARGRFDLKRFLAFPHLLVSAVGDDVGAVDIALGKMGQQRQLALVLSSLYSVPAALACSDLLATMSGRVAEDIANRYGLACRPLPLRLTHRRLGMVWHRRHDGNLPHQWLRRKIRELARAK